MDIKTLSSESHLLLSPPIPCARKDLGVFDNPQIELRTDQPEKFSLLEDWLVEQGYEQIYRQRLTEITANRKVKLFGLQHRDVLEFMAGKRYQLLLHCIFEFESSSQCGGIVLDLFGDSLEITTHT